MILIWPKEKYFYFYIENIIQIYISFLNFYFNKFVIMNLIEAEQWKVRITNKKLWMHKCQSTQKIKSLGYTVCMLV